MYLRKMCDEHRNLGVTVIHKDGYGWHVGTG
jgi:hypothetical protein